MIPARLQCPTEWTVEYRGFLMAAHGSYHKSEHVCVDQNPDIKVHEGIMGETDEISIIEAKCGSLPCPHYVDGSQVTCVVCTK